MHADDPIAVLRVLDAWTDAHGEFLVGGNETGVLLDEDVRAADGAVWLRAAVHTRENKLPRVPPVLAAEVAGRDEGERSLFAKAQWYLARGVQVVWVLLPDTREVIVVTPHATVRCRGDEMSRRITRYPTSRSRGAGCGAATR